MVKISPCVSAEEKRDTGSVPGLGRFPVGGNGNPLQYSCQEGPTEREAWWLRSMGSERAAWWATIHGVAKESDKT